MGGSSTIDNNDNITKISQRVQSEEPGNLQISEALKLNSRLKLESYKCISNKIELLNKSVI